MEIELKCYRAPDTLQHWDSAVLSQEMPHINAHTYIRLTLGVNRISVYRFTTFFCLFVCICHRSSHINSCLDRWVVKCSYSHLIFLENVWTDQMYCTMKAIDVVKTKQNLVINFSHSFCSMAVWSNETKQNFYLLALILFKDLLSNGNIFNLHCTSDVLRLNLIPR